MKKLLTLLLLVLCISVVSKAGVADMIFAQSSGTYTEITGGTVIDTDFDDEVFANIPVGFTFNANGINFTTMNVNANGYVFFHPTIIATLSSTPISSSNAATMVAAAMVRDMKDVEGLGAIRYETTGTAPNRVTTIQWKNVQRYSADYNGEMLNFQIKLYEGTNKVEFVYGPMTVSAYGSSTLQVGLRGTANTDFNNRTSTTSWDASTAGTTNSASMTISSAIFPTSGLTYTYTVAAPNAVTYVSPLNGATGMPLDISLNWTPAPTGGAALGYRVYIGTDNPPTNLVNGVDVGNVNFYAPAGLQYANTYNWQVVAYNGTGVSTGSPVWSFATSLGIGQVEGFITNAFGIPISGATVTLGNSLGSVSTTTTPTGAYSFTNIPAADYTLSATMTGYNNASVALFVAPNVTTYQNLQLTAPSMAVTPNPYNVTVNPDELLEGAFNIMNNGNGPLGWEAEIVFPDKAPKAQYPDLASVISQYPSVSSSESTGRATSPAAYSLDQNYPLRDPSDLAYLYVAYEGDSPLTPGPGSIILNAPGTITRFGSAASGTDAFICAADWANDTWYAVNYTGNVFYTIDPVTGAYTTLGTTAATVGISFNPQNDVMYSLGNDGKLYTLDLATGAATQIGNAGTTGFIAFEIDNDGIAYAVNMGTDQFGTINLETGAWTVIGPVGFDAAYAQDMSCDPSTNELYWAAYDATTGGKLVIVNKATGTSQLVGAFPGGAEIDGFAIPGSAMGDWLTLGNYTGIVTPYSTLSLPVYFNAEGTEAGEVYTANVVFTSTPNVGTVTIPVTMTVAGNPLEAPDNFTAVLTNPITGQVSMNWTAPSADFINFVIKRDGVTVGTTAGTTFTNILPTYGIYNYTVQAVYEQGNSVPEGPVEIEWANPTLLLNPTALYNEQYPASSENVTLRVSNTGEGTLAFSFPAFAARQIVNSPDFTPNVPSTVKEVVVAKGEVDPTDGAGNRNLRGAGGPDAYGYVWIDSDETGGPAYSWTDISATGTLMTGFEDDNVIGPINLGFSFPFYENFYSSVNVSSNGYLVFGGTSSAYSNQNIPSSTAPNNVLAWFWNDLTGGGTVHYQNMGDRWIIQYTNYPALSGGTITAQVHLFPNGNIRIYYNSLAGGIAVNSSTVGIENSTGTIATNINYNAAYVHNGLAVAIDFPVPSFITAVTPASGQVAAGEFVDVAVEFTANAIYHTVGTYTDELEINTNDLAHESVIIPATMVVYSPGMISGTVISAVDNTPIEAALVVAGGYSALTDANGNYSITLDANTYSVAFSKTGFTSVTVNNVVVTANATTDLDATLEEQFYPVTFVHAEVNEADTQAEVTWGTPSPEYEMFYDDGVAENFTAWAVPGNMNAVKFTPAGYPATVYGGKIFIGDGSFPNNNTGLIGTNFTALVKADDGANGLPGTTLDSIVVTVNNYGWVSFTGLDAVVESGSFYLVMLQTGISPNAAGVGIDETTPTAYRSYSLNTIAGGTWALAPYQDMMMRALVSGPATEDLAKASNEIRVPKKQLGMISLKPATAQSGAEAVAEYRAVQNDKGSREVIDYTIWRVAVANPEVGPNGTETLLTDVSTTSYVDNAFENLPQGWYAYAVAANYTNGGQSPKAYSNIVGHEKFVTVTVNVSLTTGQSPAGAVVSLTGADYPHQVLTQTVTETGTVVFEDLAKGNYELLANKAGFDEYVFNANIQSNRTFDVVLAESKFKPRNLYVDGLTLVATWDEPLSVAVLEDFEGTTFPPAGWQAITQNTTGWYATTDASSTNWTVPAHTKYAVTNDDTDNGEGCCDYLITPEMDFTNLDSYRLNFASFFDAAFGQSAYVELSTDGGETWTVIHTMEAATSWVDMEIDLTQYSGASGLSSAWIAFHADDNGEWAAGWAIDDVEISSGGVPLQGYGVFLDGTLVGNTMEETYTYTNLNYGQEYLAGVAALFSSGYSELDTYLFKSLYLAPPDSLQGENPALTDYVILTWIEPAATGGGTGGTLIEDFEAGTLPEGWLSLDEDGDGYVWDNTAVEFSTFDAHTGAYCMTSASYINNIGALTPNNWLITPAIQIGSQSELRFWVDGQDPDYAAEQYYVKVSTTGTNVADFTETVHSAVAGPDWAEVVVDLSDFAGNQVYVAFVHADVTDMYFLKLDDVTIANATGMWPATTPVANNNVSNAVPFRTSGMTSAEIGAKLDQYNMNVAKNSVRSVRGIIGYNVYRDSEMIGYVQHPTTEYYDLNLEPGTYSYHITGVYDLTSYGFPFQTGESMIEGPIDVDVVYGNELPFVEDFSTGVFTTNEWTVDGTNWQIAGQQGNPLPSAMFTYAPAQVEYNLSMSSNYMIGAGYVDGKIYLDFDIKLDDNTATGDEKMVIEVYNGESWNSFATITANGDKDWEAKHVDITSAAKGNVFRVRFTAVGINSLDINNWLVDNIHIYRLCEAPTNLEASILDANHQDQIMLTWEGPSVPVNVAEWIMYDDGVNSSGIGVGVDATWAAAIRFTPTQLAEYAGTSLTKIRFVPASESAGCTFVLKVWTGANASTLVASQPVSSFTAATWNEYTLNTPVFVSGTTELWIGYEVTQVAAAFPGGTDDGPAIDGYGDMANLDGVWETLVNLNPQLNFNWNIQGFVETLSAANQNLQPIADNSEYNAHGAILAKSNVINDSPNAIAPTASTKEFAGYNIYRDEVLIGTTTETEYLDSDPFISVLNQEYCYQVTATYTDCESDFSNTACATVTGAEDLDVNAVSIYPNPSNNVINIELTNNISQLVIYNGVGQIVNEMTIAKDKNVQLNVRNYQAGAYLVKFITNSGESFTKRIAVTK